MKKLLECFDATLEKQAPYLVNDKMVIVVIGCCSQDLLLTFKYWKLIWSHLSAVSNDALGNGKQNWI